MKEMMKTRMSQNIFKVVETERLMFYMGLGSDFPSPEEALRFEALGVELTDKHYDIELWLNSDKHLESISDIKKVIDKILTEEAIEEAVAEENW